MRALVMMRSTFASCGVPDAAIAEIEIRITRGNIELRREWRSLIFSILRLRCARLAPQIGRETWGTKPDTLRMSAECSPTTGRSHCGRDFSSDAAWCSRNKSCRRVSDGTPRRPERCSILRATRTKILRPRERRIRRCLLWAQCEIDEVREL